MGTAGVYGGTNTQPWRDVHDAFNEMPSGPGNPPPTPPNPPTPPTPPRPPDEGSDTGYGGDQDPAANLGRALANALAAGDAGVTATGPPSPYTIGSLIGRNRGGGGGGGGATGPGALRGQSGAAGRSGNGSRRSLGRSAARGGVVIGGAYALRAGDAAALAALGLDLNTLKALSPRAQCARILDAVLGEGGHPDEAALRAAAVAQVKAILTDPNPPAEGDALRGFIASYVYQLGLLELRSGLAAGTVDAATATNRESGLRHYLHKRVQHMTFPARGRFSLVDFAAHADGLIRDMLRMLRAV